MKKLLSIFAIAAILGACSNNNKTNTSNVSLSDLKECASISVDSFLMIAGDIVGKEITVKGTVDHVCKHSGQRIKLVSSVSKNYIFGISTEKVDTFKTELEGSDVCLIGVVVETKMDSVCVPRCEAKESEMEHKECANQSANLDQIKKDQEETEGSNTGNVVTYSINVSDYHICGSANEDGCGHIKNSKDEPAKACCGGKDEKESDVDKSNSGESKKPFCEKK